MRGLVLIIVAGFGSRPIRRRLRVGGRRRALVHGRGNRLGDGVVLFTYGG